MGRAVREPNGSVRLGFPGIAATIAFTGTSLAWQMWASNDENYFDVSVDGEPFRKVKAAAGDQRLVLAEGLPDDEHVARIVRRTESWEGVSRIDGVLLERGAALRDPPPLPQRRLMFIGDSITAGACVERLPPEFDPTHGAHNANRSYGMELGRRLDAQAHLIAYGGRGLVRDYQGWLADQTPTGPMIFERSMPDEADSRWDHSAYDPHGIVIAFGTNDFAVGIPDEQQWTRAYSAFISRIREVHAGAWIVLAGSPMFSPRILNGDFARRAAMEHYLDEVVTLRQEAGDYRVEKLMHRHQPGTLKDSHPIWPQHLLMADDLEPVLRARLLVPSPGTPGEG